MSEQTDILIAGAGAAGLSAGIALAQAGRRVTVVGEIDLRASARTVALFEASLAFYDSIGLLDAIAAESAPLEVMRIVDDTGSLFRLPQRDFRAREIGLDQFGYNIENCDLVRLLADAARATPGLTLTEGRLSDFAFAGSTASACINTGETIQSGLMIAADGRRSAVRAAAGISVTETPYPQTALTAILAHTRPHREASTEFHTRTGPFTLVPLPPRDGDKHRSSLVWMTTHAEAERLAALPPQELALVIERQAHSMLGKMRLLGPCGAFPMVLMKAAHFTGERVALIGDAAHAFPPIGAQGLNLGLRDVGHLVEAVRGAGDPGAPEVLRDYEARRAADIRLRTAGVDLLNRSLLAPFLPVDFLRGAGLLALSGFGPLRRAIMREGVSPAGRTPAMMRRDQRPNRL
jgi:2-octaprenyl-6-methoxyphenol hydroxylase